MLLPVMTAAALTAALVTGCLLDIARTPWFAFGRVSRRNWLLIVALLWPFGALAWLAGGRSRCWPAPHGRRRRLSQREARRRHPAWRSAEHARHQDEDTLTALDGPAERYGFDRTAADRTAADRTAIDQAATASCPPGWSGPLGPDDDPDFLRELHRRIHGQGELPDRVSRGRRKNAGR